LDFADLVTMATLPTLTALLATALLMRKPGLQAFWRAIGISAAMFVVFLFVSWFWHPQARFGKILFEGWRPWSLNSPWSSVLAWAVVAFYLAVNAAFLQPYLGDAGNTSGAPPPMSRYGGRSGRKPWICLIASIPRDCMTGLSSSRTALDA
jgi:hypothetical protein